METKYRLFIGNPGVGKSTMVNCLAQKVLFKNGVSLGQGMTFQMDTATHDGITYIDTPGLADVKLRKAAAEAITKGLKQNGVYQIFFVVTLEAGRVRPEDLVTINLVLKSVKGMISYNLIINKLTKRLYDDFTKEDFKKLRSLQTELNFGQDESQEPPRILLLLRNDEMDDSNNTFAHFEELEEFVNHAPLVPIDPSNVEDLPSDDGFDKEVEILQSQLESLRSDNELMKNQIQLTDKRYNKLLEKNAELMKASKSQLSHEMKEYEEKIQQLEQIKKSYEQRDQEKDVPDTDCYKVGLLTEKSNRAENNELAKVKEELEYYKKKYEEAKQSAEDRQSSKFSIFPFIFGPIIKTMVKQAMKRTGRRTDVQGNPSVK